MAQTVVARDGLVEEQEKSTSKVLYQSLPEERKAELRQRSSAARQKRRKKMSKKEKEEVNRKRSYRVYCLL